jgi:hypothetical protein
VADSMRPLIQVLQDTRAFLMRPGNDFAWSSWEGPEQAISEIDGFIEELTAGRMPDRLAMGVLFAPTGQIQEVSVSSGWGDEFLHLAERFDAAEASNT